MNTSLNPELVELTTKLCDALAQDQKIISSKARIGLFFQNADATKLFQDVNNYGEELRNKHLSGMAPTEEEIAKFDELRQAVVENDLARGFLEARQQIDEVLGTINQFLGMSIDLGRAPSLDEVEEARKQSMSASCSCGGECEGDCGDDCNCDKGGDCGCH